MSFLKRLFNRNSESTSLGTSQSICPYCNQALEPKPKRKKKCPHCNGTIYVSKGNLLTEEENFISAWVHRLEGYGITLKQFQVERQKLSKQFGSQASPNDTVWRILNTLVTKDAGTAYYLMAALAREENKSPTPYLAESTKQSLLNYKKSGVVTQVKAMSANDNSVCPSCKAMAGKVFSIDQALRDMPIPHKCTSDYGCRCGYSAEIGR